VSKQRFSLNRPDGSCTASVWIRDRHVVIGFSGRDGQAVLVLDPEGARALINTIEAHVEAVERGRRNFLCMDA
jgi:hypothetical protein